MRAIRKLILQSSGHAGDTLSRVDARHRRRGLRCVGFHYVIRENGTLERGRPLREVGAHCLGYNTDSVGVCLCGKGQLTDAQTKKLRGLSARLIRHYPAIKPYLARELDPWLRDALVLDKNHLIKEN
jgi:N-acetylmuramoyl-L-alanine amidase